MSLFYFDKEIENFERNLDFKPVIILLENRLKQHNDIQTFITILVDSWFYFIEGDVNQKPKDYDWNFFLNKWKDYVKKGLERYKNESEFCLIAGYTLILHGFYLDDTYEDLGIKLIETCLTKSKNEQLKDLAKYWLDLNENKKSKVDISNICKNLFNTDSLIDKYFAEILMK